MEEVTHPGSGVGDERLSEVKVDGNVQEILINGDGNPQDQEGNKHEKGIPHSTNENTHNSSKDLFEAQDKIEVVEHQLQTVIEELQNLHSDRTKFKSGLYRITIEKLKLITALYEELQLERKRMREMSARYNFQEALKDLDGKCKEDKEALVGLRADMEITKKKFEEFALQLEEIAVHARNFEELSSHTMSQLQRALELVKMMETANQMEHNRNTLQEELKVVNHRHRLEESTQVVEIPTATKMEIAESFEKLDVTKSHVGDLSSKEACIRKFSQQLDLYLDDLQEQLVNLNGDKETLHSSKSENELKSQLMPNGNSWRRQLVTHANLKNLLIKTVRLQSHC